MFLNFNKKLKQRFLHLRFIEERIDLNEDASRLTRTTTCKSTPCWPREHRTRTWGTGKSTKRRYSHAMFCSALVVVTVMWPFYDLVFSDGGQDRDHRVDHMTLKSAILSQQTLNDRRSLFRILDICHKIAQQIFCVENLGPSRGGKGGNVFPGPATFRGPAIAQKYWKGCFRSLLSDLKYAYIHFRFRSGLCPGPRWGSLRRPKPLVGWSGGHPLVSSLLTLLSRCLWNEVVIGPRDNGFPGPAVALDGPVENVPTNEVSRDARGVPTSSVCWRLSVPVATLSLARP